MKILDNDKILPWIVVALYAVIGFAIYSDVILNGIFIFDDFEYVVGNEVLKNVSFFNLDDPRQVGYLSFALNYALDGENPFGYHLGNVIIHIANAILAFFLIRLLLVIAGPQETGSERRRILIAFLTGLIFLVHPVETQAVSYVTQRFTSLTALFYLLSVLSYLRARMKAEEDDESRSAYLWYGLSFLGTIVAMRTKEVAFTIPLLIAAFEYLLFRGSRFGRRRFVFLVPFAALTFIIPVSILAPEFGLTLPGGGITEVTRREKIYDLTERSPFIYLITQFRVIVTYLRLLILPVSQRVVYDFQSSQTLFEARVLFSLGILFLLLLSALFAWRRAKKDGIVHPSDYRLAALGVVWFFLTISVESSIIPIKDLIFEHRVYLPAMGLFAAFSALVVRFVEYRITTTKRRYAAAAVIAGMIISLAVATYIRNEVWTDDVRFWGDVVAKNPDKAIGYNNRGNAYAKRGQHELALRDLNKTISWFPKDPNEKTTYERADFTTSNMAKTYMTRASVFFDMGEVEKGNADIALAKALIAVEPRDFRTIIGSADAYFKRGDYANAIQEYNKVLQWDPDNMNALMDRANAYSLTGNYKDAISDLSRLIAMSPGFAAAYHNRGEVYVRSNNKEKAMEDFEAACRMGIKAACEGIERMK